MHFCIHSYEPCKMKNIDYHLVFYETQFKKLIRKSNSNVITDTYLIFYPPWPIARNVCFDACEMRGSSCPGN